jgi:hypothetical protein
MYIQITKTDCVKIVNESLQVGGGALRNRSSPRKEMSRTLRPPRPNQQRAEWILRSHLLGNNQVWEGNKRSIEAQESGRPWKGK